MTSPADDRRDVAGDAALDPLLAELRDTLEALRAELEESRTRPRLAPPTPRELLRFTEQHTIPTLIAVLETNVRLLELARGVLRLADPEREASASPGAAREALSGVARGGADATLSRLDDALSELRRALAETDLPEDPTARSLVDDARALASEVDARVDEARAGVDGARSGRRGEREGAGTTVPVRGPDDEPDEQSRGRADAAGDADRGDADPSVDVEAELDSIREAVRGGDGRDPSADESGPDDGEASGRADEGGDAGGDRPGD